VDFGQDPSPASANEKARDSYLFHLFHKKTNILLYTLFNYLFPLFSLFSLFFHPFSAILSFSWNKWNKWNKYRKTLFLLVFSGVLICSA